MKNIIHLRKGWLKSSPGFTLAELMVAMSIGGLIMAGVLTIWTQMFSVTATNSNYVAAYNQAQNAGNWISHDALMAQEVYDMTLTTLNGGIGAGATPTITVASTEEFPPFGIISIEDELIQYTDRTDTQFTDCTRGYGGTTATPHTAGEDVTVFLSLNWTEWSGVQRQVFYNLKADSRQLVRSYFTDGSPDSSTIIAEAMVVDDALTYNVWNYDQKELVVQITADVGGYILGRWGVQSQAATRVYKVNPRTLF